MLKISTDSVSFLEYLRGCLRAASKFVSEMDIVMNPVADCLHALPARLSMTKHCPCNGGEQIHLAITAREQVLQRLWREVAYVPLWRGWIRRVGFA